MLATSDHGGLAGVRLSRKELNSGQRLLVGVELVMRMLSFGWVGFAGGGHTFGVIIRG